MINASNSDISRNVSRNICGTLPKKTKRRLKRNILISVRDNHGHRRALADAHYDIRQSNIFQSLDLDDLLQSDFGETVYFNHDNWDEFDWRAFLDDLPAEVIHSEIKRLP